MNMETDNNNYNLSNTINSQGEVSQVNTSESVSNGKPPPDLSLLIDKLKSYKEYCKKETNLYHLGRLDIINFVLTSLGIED